MNSENEIRISYEAADRLIAAHDADVALLYLFMRRSGTQDREEIARALCWTLSQTSSALEKLRRMMPESVRTAPEPAPARPLSSDAPLPAETIPDSYTSAEIVRRSKEDSVFSSIVTAAQKALGHTLSTPDLKTLFGIYDSLSLPPDVVMQLLNYCADAVRGSDGETRKLTIRYVEKVAYTWVKLEIFTWEQAEDYIRRDKLRREETAKITEALDLRGRKLASDERSYIVSWIDMGFGVAAVEEAYNRTVINTGGLKWQYMNKILTNWHQNGIHTLEEIEQKDARKQRGTAPAQSNDRHGDTADLDRLFETIG